MTPDNPTSTSQLRRTPKVLRSKIKATRKSFRNYEVVLCINVGKAVTAALAVIEDGHATYAVGDLTQGQLLAHLSKVDLAIGTHLREHEQLRTETLLEKLEQSGIEVYKPNAPSYSTRYYAEALVLRFPTKVQSVTDTLRDYLQRRGFSVAKSNEKLHVRHLERMRPRTGYIIKEEVE